MAKRKAKRANGDGSIRKLPDGRWKATASRVVNGELKRKSRICQNMAEVRAFLAGASTSLGKPLADKSVTVSAYLRMWLDQVVSVSRRPSTVYLYRNSFAKHVEPHIGDLPLAGLAPQHIQQMVFEWSKSGQRRVHQISFTTLSAALKYACKTLRWISSNPTEDIKRPRCQKRPQRYFTADDAARILAAAEGTDARCILALAIGAGLRQGELFGLQWQDISGDCVHIRRQAVQHGSSRVISDVKTEAGNRVVVLPMIAVEALRRHIANNPDREPTGFVFTGKTGQPFTRSSFGKWKWRPLLRSLGIEHRGMHHLRHLFATLAISNGAPLAVVADTLGHSQQSVTFTYSHAIEAMRRETANAIDRCFPVNSELTPPAQPN